MSLNANSRFLAPVSLPSLPKIIFYPISFLILSCTSLVESINLTLSAKVKTLSEDQSWKQLECTREIRGDTRDEIRGAQLRVDGSGYRLYVIGKNGTAKRVPLHC
jgi:hypothetical protein